MQNVPPFHLFGTVHLITLGIITLIAIIVPWMSRKYASPVGITRFAWIIGLVLILHELVKMYFRIYVYDFPWQNELPFHLCRMGAILTGIMLITRNYFLFEITYFWGLGGAVQALLTPDIKEGFPHGVFLFFFIGHGLIILGVVFAMVNYKYKPTFKSMKKVFILTNLVALPMIPLNFLINSNYLFLREKPAAASILDFLGPWPYYLIGMEVLMIMIFAVYYLPFAIINRANRTHQADSLAANEG